MKELNDVELRKVQLGILDYFVEVCEKHGLTYWLNNGTLLGAIRHKGYIPWDDDIDVTMLRDDYNKLIEIFDNGCCKYKFSCVENDPECMYPFGKIIDTDTILYENGESGIKIGVYIDIFVYDDAPMDENIRKTAFDKLDHYGHLRKYQLPWDNANLSLKRVGALLKKKCISFLPRQYYTRKIVESAKKYNNEKSEYVCDLTDPFYYSRWIAEKSLFINQTEVEFEGKLYKAPADYDKWLTMQYGDYMVLPPKEKRKKHNVKAYYK